MGVKSSGNVIINGSCKVLTESDISLPQGDTLVASYDAGLNSLPSAQGWSSNQGDVGVQVISDPDDSNLTLEKRTVSSVQVYYAETAEPGWLVDLDIKVRTNTSKSFSHTFYIQTSVATTMFEFATDSIYVYNSGTLELVTYYDFQSKYVKVKILEDPVTYTVTMYLDDVLVSDNITQKRGGAATPYAFIFGDASSFNVANNICYWRTIDCYNGWS